MPTEFAPSDDRSQIKHRSASEFVRQLLLPNFQGLRICDEIGYEFRVRAAMLASALKFRLCPTGLNFTGALQSVEEFASCLRLRSGRYREQWESLLATLSELTVGHCPGTVRGAESREN